MIFSAANLRNFQVLWADPRKIATPVVVSAFTWCAAANKFPNFMEWHRLPPLLILYRVAKHLQKHALEQVVELLFVFFVLFDQTFHFAEQISNADLVVERRERNFQVKKVCLC